MVVSGGSFIARLSAEGTGPRLGVKDVIDVAGVVTTGGSRVVAEKASPARRDASCVAGARRAGAVVVGKTTLVELALGAHGMNRWYGTPENPLGAELIPGGSSSGSAVAVASSEVDVAYGTDTGGSIRIPAACCGVVGLKPTHGLVAGDGVMPLAPSFDCVGPIARSVGGIEIAMEWLGIAGRVDPPGPPITVRFHAAGADAAVVEAVRRALMEAGLTIEERAVPGWEQAWRAGGIVLDAEAAGTFRRLRPLWGHLDEKVAARLYRGDGFATEVVGDARRACARWRTFFREIAADRCIVATPTLPALPPTYLAWESLCLNWFTLPVNVAGLPAIVVPVPRRRGLPASVQLIGPSGGEALLLAAARRVELAAGAC